MMGLFEHWPYVNFHDLNLDWIIKEFPKVYTSRDEAQASAEASAESAAASQMSADAALASKESAHQSELNAAQSEENAADSEANAKNYADHIADPVAGLVTDWLTDNITPTTPAVDASLTVSGAAADAKVTGDEITELKNSLELVEPNVQIYPRMHRGTINVNNGTVSPSETVLNRLYSDSFSTSAYDRIAAKNGINVYVIYYNSDMTFAGNSGGFKKNVITIDQTYPIARVMLANVDNSDFSEVIEDGVLVYNTTRSCLADSHFNDIMEATGVKRFLYSHSQAVINMVNTVRWFIPHPVPTNSMIKNISIHSSSGTVTVELWKKTVSTFIRVAIYELTTAVETDTEKNIFNLGYKTEDDNIYISMFGSSGTVVKGSSGNVDGMYIVRDTTSTSFYESALSGMSGYLVAADVEYYNLPPANRTYTIGQNDNVAEVITEAMKYSGSTVYIEPYEHDCIAEWEAFFGSGYFANMSSGRGLELKNDVHIIGRSGHKLKCYYTGSNDYVMENFSLFNNSPASSGYTLENVCIDVKKIRYCVHDERGSDDTPYRVKYKRCIMSQDMTGSTWDHSRACIGGGLGAHADVIVEDCIFSTVTSNANKDSLAYHNSESGDAENSLVIKNCYCTGDSTLQLASYGTSTKMTKVLVANCSFGSAIEELDWTGGTPNLEIYYINNVVRN